jgi:hypothetical protein
MTAAETEYIEIRVPMLIWLRELAESKGVTVQEFVTHIILLYEEDLDYNDEDEPDENDNGLEG